MNPSIPPAPESPGRKANIPDKSSPRHKQQQPQQEATPSKPADVAKSQQQRTPEPVAKTATAPETKSVTSSGDNNGDVVGEYVLGETIGKGTFGKVRLGLHLLTGEKVAVKILEKKRIVQAADVERVAREIKILKRNRHQNVIQLYEVIDSPERIFLIMEHVDGGEMFEYIVAHHRIREPEAAYLFRQIVDGLAYLHANEITHRDLKPENLLLQSTRHTHRQQHDPSTPSLLVKIVDFGLSNTHDGGRLLRTACGSPCYAAPEMIQGRLYHGPVADMWSLGVVLFAMVCGFLPFEDSNTNLLYKKILSANYKMPTFLSPNVQDLIRRILETDPEKRYTVDKIRQHPWLAGVAVPEVSGFDANGAAKSDDAIARHDLVLNQLESLGLAREDVQGALSKKAFNRLTASYFLLDGKLQRIMKTRLVPMSSLGNPVGMGNSERPTRRESSASSSHSNEAKRPEQTARTTGSDARLAVTGSASDRKNSAAAEPHRQNSSSRTHDTAQNSPRRRSTPHHHHAQSHHEESPYTRRAVTPSNVASPRHSARPSGEVSGAPQRPSSVRGGRNLVLTNGSAGIPGGAAFLPVAPNPRDHRQSGVLTARKPQANSRVTVSNGMVALRPLAQPGHPPRRELLPSTPQSSARRYSTDAAQHMTAPPVRTVLDTTPRHMNVVAESPHAITTNGGVVIRRRPGPSPPVHADNAHSPHHSPVTTAHPVPPSDVHVVSSYSKSDDTRSPQKIAPPPNS